MNNKTDISGPVSGTPTERDINAWSDRYFRKTKAVVEAFGDFAKQPWVGKRDVAIATLLYGCGLRIAEALALDVRDAPKGDQMTVLGKGAKERMVPVLPAVRQAIDVYLEACPHAATPDRALFVGVRGGCFAHGSGKSSLGFAGIKSFSGLPNSIPRLPRERGGSLRDPRATTGSCS